MIPNYAAVPPALTAARILAASTRRPIPAAVALLAAGLTPDQGRELVANYSQAVLYGEPALATAREMVAMRRAVQRFGAPPRLSLTDAQAEAAVVGLCGGTVSECPAVESRILEDLDAAIVEYAAATRERDDKADGAERRERERRDERDERAVRS